MKLLKDLYEIHSPSYGEKKMKRFIKRWVRWIVPDAKIVAEGRNLYIVRGEADTYPCVVAHLDQVQKNHSADFMAVETKDIIFGYSPSNRRFEGLGADDKNGIWIALRCLQKYEVMKVAFFYGEEVGCLGSERADMSFFNDVRFVIEPDRRGHNDLITSISYTDLCSDEFVKQIKPDVYGYSEENGLMTDVEQLKDKGLKVSCINLSCGYYKPHTDEEYTVKADLLNCLAFVQHIIETVTEPSEHEAVNYGYGRRWGYSPAYNRNTAWTTGMKNNDLECYSELNDLKYFLSLNDCDTYEQFKEAYGDWFCNLPDKTIREEFDKYKASDKDEKEKKKTLEYRLS